MLIFVTVLLETVTVLLESIDLIVTPAAPFCCLCRIIRIQHHLQIIAVYSLLYNMHVNTLKLLANTQ